MTLALSMLIALLVLAITSKWYANNGKNLKWRKRAEFFRACCADQEPRF